MTGIRRRLIIAAVLLAGGLALYGTGKYFSPSLILYVVEQSLVQKAPPGTDPARLRERLRALIASDPGRDARMERLLRISGQLEKVQSLTAEDVDRLLANERK